MNELIEALKNIGKDYTKKDITKDAIDEPYLMQQLIESIKLIKDIDVRVKDKKGNNLLHLAANQYFSNLDLFNILIKKGVLINEPNKKGDIVLHILLCDHIYFFDEAKIDIIKLLLKKGADINIKNKLGLTVLDYLIENISDHY